MTLPVKSYEGQIPHQIKMADTIEAPRRKKVWHEVDGSYAWVQVVAAGITLFFLDGLHRSFSLLYQAMITRYGRSDSVTSWVPSVCGTVKMCASPLIGLLIQRFNERTVCFIGAVTASVALALTAVSPSIELVFLFFGFFYAIGMSSCIISGQTNIIKYFDKKRGRATGVVSACMSVGSLVLSPLIYFLFEEYNYSGAMLILSAIVSHIFVSAVLMRPMPAMKCDEDDISVKIDLNHDINSISKTECDETDSNKPKTGSDIFPLEAVKHHEENGIAAKEIDINESMQSSCPHTTEYANKNIVPDRQLCGPVIVQNVPEESQQSKCSTLAKVFTDKLGLHLLKIHSFAMMCGYMFGWTLCLDVSLTFQTAIISEMGYSKTQAVVSLIVFNTVDLPSRLISGFFYDHHILRNYKILVSTVFFFTMAFFQLLLPFALKANFILGMICLALTSANRAIVGSQHPNVIAMVVGKEQFATAIGINRFCQGIGFVISAPIGGFLKDMTGTYATGYIVTASLLLCESSCYLAAKGIGILARRHRS